MTGAALQVDDLTIGFVERRRTLVAVRNLSFAIAPGEALAIVGESGCGKSLTALSLLGLLPKPGRVLGGSIRVEGEEIVGRTGEALRRLRGDRIAMIFQEPMTALNPVLTVGKQIVEAVRAHRAVSRAEARERAVALLERVRIPDAGRRLDEFPHRLSGGMRQRVMIAMALACDPAVLVADEPTTALDVTIQAQILDLIDDLRRERGMAVALITHDLGVVARHAERTLVMYAGAKVEERPTAELFADPRHPYTRGLIAARPGGRLSARRRLTEIPGRVPALDEMPAGCAFAPRCDLADDACRAAPPPLEAAGAHGLVACLKARSVERAPAPRAKVAVHV
ncbi:ABC transporter ATP-binding protein [Methylopila sp. Yamaguchi]|uniref:ABC transporter ATP-binding protein n=1 Tax=Methylopila sp. Yamaguchi TaxID=1437817 RepID=UPI000CCB9481|nr:ABC transporter ATP-binding protein [Methylopila sp. Yamaguchi]GBD46827.1 dipeptide/oligopeptide/nickel ABC transporter ATPase [Methylopila sp. Yamaguchi]